MVACSVLTALSDARVHNGRTPTCAGGLVKMRWRTTARASIQRQRDVNWARPAVVIMMRSCPHKRAALATETTAERTRMLNACQGRYRHAFLGAGAAASTKPQSRAHYAWQGCPMSTPHASQRADRAGPHLNGVHMAVKVMSTRRPITNICGPSTRGYAARPDNGCS